MPKLTLSALSILLFVTIFSCQKRAVVSDLPATGQQSAKMAALSATTTVENFESGTKGSYAAANVTLSTGVWNFSDALIGNLSTDRKNGSQSARVRNSGKLTMEFDLSSGASTVSVLHAKFGSDGNSTWQ